MRWTALALVLMLSGCVADFFAPTPTRLGFAFDSGGIVQDETGLRIDFGRAQDSTIESASTLFGALPDEVIEFTGCDTGAMVTASWPGVSLNFLGGRFVGWVLGAPGLPAGGVTVGQPSASLPPVDFAETRLGTQFEVDGVVGLIFPGETDVGQLWSGLTCSAR